MYKKQEKEMRRERLTGCQFGDYKVLEILFVKNFQEEGETLPDSLIVASIGTLTKGL